MGRRQPKRLRQHSRHRPRLRRGTWRPKCECGKVIFPDEITADMALTRGVGKKGSIRSYECTVVPGNWHTTSQEYEDWQAKQEHEESQCDED